MSLGKILHPQLIDNLAKGLHVRFNMKADSKEIIAFIKKFGGKDEDDTWVASGFPIGKIQSLDHLNTVKLKGMENENFYNVTTGKYIKNGNPKIVYFDGYCVERNTPEHMALLKIVKENDENSEETIEIDEKDGWAIVKGTSYIWSIQKNKIVGRFKNGEPTILSQKVINEIKEKGLEWERVDDDTLKKYCLTN